MKIDLSKDYYGQRALNLNNVWFGDECYIDYMKDRFDAILPKRMDNMTLLDVGPFHGAFSFEAVNRGIESVLAVELDEGLANKLQDVSKELCMPIEVINRNILDMDMSEFACIPYSLGLVLNVLHINENPKDLLCKVLKLCKRVVVEVPFCSGASPIRESDRGDGVRMWQFPPCWIEAIGRDNGFSTTIMVSPLASESRLLFFLNK